MAHLHALLASGSPQAILIKRGPGRRSCTIGWDRRTDAFSLGQWIGKPLDHRSADLSPDGSYFLYYVNDGSWTRRNHVYRAISRSPWLKAAAFWGAAPQSYGPGAGLFFSSADGRLRLRARPCAPDWDHLGIEVVPDFPDTRRWKAMVEPESIFFVRLQRDGWVAVTPWEKCPPIEASGEANWREKAAPHRIIFEKPLPFGWTLRQTCWCGLHHDENRGVAWESFTIVSPSGAVDARRSWEWADDDGSRRRVVWTEDGVLYAAGISPAGLGAPSMLLDTRGMTFERRIAPY
jgi:hypothetical protein